MRPSSLGESRRSDAVTEHVQHVRSKRVDSRWFRRIPQWSPEVNMRKLVLVLALSLPLTAVSVQADAKGCLKGAAVGGVAGRVVKHHGLIGAAIGCAVGRHRANKK